MIKKNIFRVFNISFFHLTIWTLIPTISNVNLPLDTIEALAWGSNLEWDLINTHLLVPSYWKLSLISSEGKIEHIIF